MLVCAAGQIQSLESRLKYAEVDLANSTKKIADNEKKMKAMEAELAKNKPIVAELERTLQEKADTVAQLEADLAKREEKIFRDFSKRVGVTNIREFENERLKLAEQYHAEKVRLTTELTNLQNQLDYEKHRDLTKPIEQAQKRIAEIEAKLAHAKKEDAKVEEEIEKERAKVDELIEESKKINKEMEKKQAELKEAKKKGQHATQVRCTSVCASRLVHVSLTVSCCCLFVVLVLQLRMWRMMCSVSTSTSVRFAVRSSPIRCAVMRCCGKRRSTISNYRC
jgi:structural maintenance of chromosome 1